jgi:hypothetical protein
MNHSATPHSFSIGWDVGGWNCDKNTRSRDAIVILDSAMALVGQPWRGNLRVTINEATTPSEWIRRLFCLCQAEPPGDLVRVTMAIDTPLGFSVEFLNLITRRQWTEPLADSGTNPYLFRQTERHLFQRGLRPLSAIKDMIGSQATKGMHALAKFAPVVESCGVWTDGRGYRAIETYPTACRDAKVVQGLLNARESLGSNDLEDARTCAFVAHLFATDRDSLERPSPGVPHSEGWIWVPKDSPLVPEAAP